MNKPTLWKVFKGDYVVGNGIPFVIIATGLGIYFIIDDMIDPLIAYIAFGLALIYFLFSLWKIKRIFDLFENGIAVKAQIINLWHYRSSARIVSVYQYDTQDIKGTYNAHRSAYTRSLSQGDQVTVLFHPNKPKKCIVAEVFQ